MKSNSYNVFSAINRMKALIGQMSDGNIQPIGTESAASPELGGWHITFSFSGRMDLADSLMLDEYNKNAPSDASFLKSSMHFPSNMMVDQFVRYFSAKYRAGGEDVQCAAALLEAMSDKILELENNSKIAV